MSVVFGEFDYDDENDGTERPNDILNHSLGALNNSFSRGQKKKKKKGRRFCVFVALRVVVTCCAMFTGLLLKK